MTIISSHVLDNSSGLPAENLSVNLECLLAGKWELLCSNKTSTQGRLAAFDVSSHSSNDFRLVFYVSDYYKLHGQECFFPDIVVRFLVDKKQPFYHVPLLISPFAFSTYRGS